MLEVIKDIGALLGYCATAIALFATIRATVLARSKKFVEEAACTEESDKIHHELDARLKALEEKFGTFMDRDSEFKETMGSHIATQQLVDRKLMANIIEQLYYQNRGREQLDDNEFRRLVEVYALYHSPPVNGNSYISELYNLMMTWERI